MWQLEIDIDCNLIIIINQLIQIDNFEQKWIILQ